MKVKIEYESEFDLPTTPGKDYIVFSNEGLDNPNYVDLIIDASVYTVSLLDLQGAVEGFKVIKEGS